MRNLHFTPGPPAPPRRCSWQQTAPHTPPTDRPWSDRSRKTPRRHARIPPHVSARLHLAQRLNHSAIDTLMPQVSASEPTAIFLKKKNAAKKNAARPRSRAQAPTKRTIKPSLYCLGKIGPSVADHGRGTRPINRPDLGFATGFGSASSRRPTTARRAFTRWYAAAEHSAQVSNAGRAVRKQQTTHFP
jgi:hypothetical protein